MYELNQPDEAIMEKLKEKAKEFYESKNAVQRDIWSLEDVQIVRETHEMIKPNTNEPILIEFPNDNQPVVKAEEQSSENFAKSDPF
jgi:DeoR/GlpR family transcriptional regulator of sugar metabolism